MLNSFVTSIFLAALAQPPASAAVQISTGWCSPNIANVVGNVTVNCIGVDPRALVRLNAELSRKNLDLASRINEANEWAARYKDLESRLAQSNDDSALSKQAEDDLHQGELEKAGAILDQILAGEEKQVDRIAANHYNRALVFELQFDPLGAMPHLEAAYRYRPDEVKYGQEYGSALRKQLDFIGAEPILLKTLGRARELAKTDPGAYQPVVAKTLYELGFVYRRTERPKEAEAALQESLDIRRQLAKVNPTVHEPDVATALVALALLYARTQRIPEAETAFQEALTICRQHTDSNPAIYQPIEASVLLYLSTFYIKTQRMKDANAALQEALTLYTELAKKDPAAYQRSKDETQYLLGIVNGKPAGSAPVAK